MTIDELRVVMDTVVRLTEIRQRGCNWLLVENFAPQMLRQLLDELNAKPAQKITGGILSGQFYASEITKNE